MNFAKQASHEMRSYTKNVLYDNIPAAQVP